MNDFSNQLAPALNTILIASIVAFIGLVFKTLLDIIPVIYNYLTVKFGIAKMTKLKMVATDIFYKIEQKGKLGNLIGTKIAMFEKLITSKYPDITSQEIEDVRDAISGEFNKDKAPLIAALEQPAAAPLINAVPAITKYFAPDGVTELAPIAPVVESPILDSAPTIAL